MDAGPLGHVAAICFQALPERLVVLGGSKSISRTSRSTTGVICRLIVAVHGFVGRSWLQERPEYARVSAEALQRHQAERDPARSWTLRSA